ncbi:MULTISPECIES: hypothetical protein [Sorangium]|uniref:hypothetical protein n=1 Tax=Sorangium TaxID=39643 RepID=UPI001F24478C|nr:MULTISPECIES: hypothetical protein [Sorangium]
MTAIFGRLQAELGDAPERDVRLVSSSVELPRTRRSGGTSMRTGPAGGRGGGA